MKAVSLFAGVGGFDLALTRAGVEVVAAVEIDKHARSVLARQFPETPLLEDVCNVTGDQLRELGFNSDGIIVGGFPCQDLSVAGKRAGLEGARSGLFWEIHRLLDETKARWFILENVPGLLSSNEGRDMGTVLGALAKLGYGIAYRVLDAQYFGVPQRRRRVFIVGCLGDDGRAPGKILDLIQSSSGDYQQSEQTRQNPSRVTNASVTKNVTPYIKVIRSGARAADGSLPAEVWAEQDVSPTLNVMDNTGESRATVLVFASHMTDGARVQHGNKINTISAHMGTGGNNVPMVASTIIFGHNAGIDVQASTVVSPTLKAGHDTMPAIAVTYPIQDGRDVEKSQNGLGIGGESDPSYTLDTTGAQAIAIQGNMIGRSDTAGPQGKGYTEANNPMFTLTQTDHHAVATSTVRRLTPLECERLQGFPDSWTEGQADSHRYKQMGNAVAVPVVQWIINRMVAAND